MMEVDNKREIKLKRHKESTKMILKNKNNNKKMQFSSGVSKFFLPEKRKLAGLYIQT